MIKKIARQQKKLLLAAFDNLKKKGELVYSTCSLEPEEDEEVIDFILEKHKDLVVRIVVEGLQVLLKEGR